MGVYNGQAVSAEVTNPAFLDANADDIALGKIGFNDQDISAISGAPVTNIQREQNALWSFIGGLLNQTKNYLPTWVSNNFGSASQTIKDKIESIDYAFGVDQTFNGNKTFNGNVTLNAEFSTIKAPDVTTAGVLNDVSTTGMSFIRFTLATQITGFANGINGKELVITNINSVNLVLKNNDSGSLAANRIYGSNDVTLQPNDSVRLKYDITSSRWRVVGGTGTNFVGKDEVPSGPVNGSNVSFSVSMIPIDGTLAVRIDGSWLPISAYTFTNPNITLNVAPALGQTIEVFYLTTGTPTTILPSVSQYNVEYPVLGSGDIAAKQITLGHTPAVPAKVVVDVIGGTGQIYSTDFVVTGNILSWNGRGLDTQVFVGTILRITYFS